MIFFQLPLLPIGTPSTVANKLNRNLPPMLLKAATAFCMNFTSMTKFSSVLKLEIHIWANSLSLHKFLARLLMYNSSQSMIPFSNSDQQKKDTSKPVHSSLLLHLKSKVVELVLGF
jgi:hypothetical protein